MRLELFCLNRPHYPYLCTVEDLEHLSMKVLSLLIHEPVKDDEGFAHIDLYVKPIKPVEYIHVVISIQ